MQLSETNIITALADEVNFEGIEAAFKTLRPDVETADYWRRQYIQLNDKYTRLANNFVALQHTSYRSLI